MLRSLVVLVLFSVFFSCGTKSTNETSTDSLHFVQHKIEKRSTLGCDEEQPKCSIITLEYLVAEGGDAAVCKQINDSISLEIGQTLVIGEEGYDSKKGFDYYVQQFVDEYNTALKEDPTYEMNWDASTVMEVEYEDEDRVSLILSNSSYMGGAHGNYFSVLMNFDKKTGKRLNLKDLIKDQTALSVLLEKAARKEYVVAEGEPMQSVGFYYESKNFPVTNNFALMKDSILFHYNPYEIAPYAMGAPSLLVAKSDLKAILQ